MRINIKMLDSLKEQTKNLLYNTGQDLSIAQRGLKEAYKRTKHHILIKSLSDSFQNSPFKSQFSILPTTTELGGNRKNSLTHDNYILLLKKLSSLNEDLLNELWTNYANIIILQKIQPSYTIKLANFPLRELYDAIYNRDGVESVKELIKVKVLLDEFLLRPQRGQIINDNVNVALRNKINHMADEVNQILEYCLKPTSNNLTLKNELLIFEKIIRKAIKEFHKELNSKINNSKLIYVAEIYEELGGFPPITEDFVIKIIEEIECDIAKGTFDFSIYSKEYQQVKIKNIVSAFGALITLIKDGTPYTKNANSNSHHFYNAIGSFGDEFNDAKKITFFNRELLEEYKKSGPLTVNSLIDPNFNCWHNFNNIKNILPEFWKIIYCNSYNLKSFKKQVKILDESLIFLHQKLDEYIPNNNFNNVSGGIVEYALLYINLHVMVELITENYTRKNIFQAMEIFCEEAAKITVTSCSEYMLKAQDLKNSLVKLLEVHEGGMPLEWRWELENKALT